MVVANHCHFLGYLLGGAAADSGVDLIEDQSLNLVTVGKDCLQRQHDSGKLTAGYDLAKRLQGLPWVGRNLILNLIETVVCEAASSGKGDGKLHIQEIQIFQALDHLFLQLMAVFPSHFRKTAAGCFQLLLGLLLLLFLVFLDFLDPLSVFCF